MQKKLFENKKTLENSHNLNNAQKNQLETHEMKFRELGCEFSSSRKMQTKQNAL